MGWAGCMCDMLRVRVAGSHPAALGDARWAVMSARLAGGSQRQWYTRRTEKSDFEAASQYLAELKPTQVGSSRLKGKSSVLRLFDIRQ